jgi:segregation and condensation protein B
MDIERVSSIVESLIFVSDRPLPFQKMAEALPEVDRQALRAALDALMDDCRQDGRGLALVEVAGGFQLRTKPENSQHVRTLLKARPQRMSRAVLETLAIIAYRQPVTRAEIEAIRGVDVAGVLATVLDRRLVQIMGRKDAVGRPFVYGTTKEFLEFFGLKDLSGLPSLRELEDFAQAETFPQESKESAVKENVPMEGQEIPSG